MRITEVIHTDLLPEAKIPYSLILPTDPQTTCLWLHGYRERAADLLSVLEPLAEQHHIAVILPDVPDTYYLDQPWNACYTERFLITEFLPVVTARHNLPAENLCIAGISMGGFGSLLLGSHFPDLFRKIVCMSGAFILEDIQIGNPEVVGTDPNNVKHFQNIFGDLPALGDSVSRNPAVAACHALEAKQLPPVFMACGTEDLLYPRNVKLRNQLTALGANITWMEGAGNHTKQFFAPAMTCAFAWLSQ